MKRLEDMNLVDDFLAYSLTAHKIYGEKASRYMLECILQRKIRHLTVVPQKVWYEENPESHGVRLDVYLDEEDGEIFDLEPDNNDSNSEVSALPRRIRFYHAKIDAGSLAAGENYSALRNVVVIFITTYDPFGLNRMVYTVKNTCVEVPALPYEDGARTIFLYTKGTEGNPPEELFLLARYMEYSTEENAGNAGLKRLHEMVTKVKADREVGAAYMKAIEIEKRIREEGRAEGRAGDVMMFLEAKGTVPPQLERAIYTQTDMNVLKEWLLLAVGAASVEEFQKQSGL